MLSDLCGADVRVKACPTAVPGARPLHGLRIRNAHRTGWSVRSPANRVVGHPASSTSRAERATREETALRVLG